MPLGEGSAGSATAEPPDRRRMGLRGWDALVHLQPGLRSGAGLGRPWLRCAQLQLLHKLCLLLRGVARRNGLELLQRELR